MYVLLSNQRCLWFKFIVTVTKQNPLLATLRIIYTLTQLESPLVVDSKFLRRELNRLHELFACWKQWGQRHVLFCQDISLSRSYRSAYVPFARQGKVCHARFPHPLLVITIPLCRKPLRCGLNVRLGRDYRCSTIRTPMRCRNWLRQVLFHYNAVQYVLPVLASFCILHRITYSTL